MERCIKITDSNEVCDKDVKYVTFILENCEFIKIPIENFSTLDINVPNYECASLQCVIEKMNDIEYRSFENYWNPFSRLTAFNDIVSIEVEFTDGTKRLVQPVWRGTNTINYCQISHMIGWNKISISINEENIMERMKTQCANKADEILDILYQDFVIDTCSNCCYKPDCDKLRKNNNDIDICTILDLM